MLIGNIKNKIKALAPSLTIYLLGMLSFLLSDVFVVKFVGDKDIVSSWAFIKATLTLAAVVAVFGSEQSILRYPQNLLSCYKKIFSRTVFYSSIIAFLLMSFSPVKSFLFWLFSIIGLAFIVVFYSVLRTSSSFYLALLSQNLWKFFLFLVIVGLYAFNYFNLYLIFLISIYLSLIIIFLIALKNKNWISYYKNHKDEKVDNKYFFSISNFFIISALTLNVSVGFEQLALNFLGLSSESALYLAHTSALLPIVLVFNGFVSFYLGPYVKNNSNLFDKKKFFKIIVVLISAAFILSVFSLLLGWLFFNSFYQNYEFNLMIASSVLLIGVFRVLYIIPSSFVGVIGRDDLTKKYIILNFISLLFVSALIFYIRDFQSIFMIILIFSILNWLFRVVLGIYYSYINLIHIKGVI